MNIVFENQGNRVKGIAFHPKYSWIIASYYTGDILIFDYVHKMLIDTYVGHEGPVRCVDFHETQPMFVSGSDDKTIKVWNYSSKKCAFTLTGHKDYIRTVQFHKELSWIISCSDDMTIRIWNWISRSLLAIASGHDHYVMSAFFHPSEDWIISASLDSTIRIWDYGELRRKFFEARTNAKYEVISMDVTLIQKLEGHERGVNWAVFHPTLNLIVSSSDDKSVRIWKYSSGVWTEADVLRGHSNNVSCVLFHPTLDLVISDSEDKTLRIWDLGRKSWVDKLVKDADRFWILANHPKIPLFAAGSDSELIVFKLESSRIPSANSQNYVLFYLNNSIKLWKESSSEKKNLCELSFKAKSFKQKVISIIRNPFIKESNNMIWNFILTIQDSSRRFLVHFLIKPGSSPKETKLENAECGCFIARNRLLLLEKGEVFACDSTNLDQRTSLQMGNIDKGQIDSVHQATIGKVFLKFKNGIVSLFDINSGKLLKETTEITEMKYVLWNNNLTHAALVGQTSIFIINKNMDILNKIKEKSSIKSTCFDENNVLFYTTYFHVKYALIEPELRGIIKSTETPIYLMNVRKQVAYYSNANQNIETHNINYTPVAFDISLMNRNFEGVSKGLTKAGKGKKLVEKVQNSGFPDLALRFVSDPKQKFDLALKSGKLEEAKEAAEELKDKKYFDKLAERAMMMGKLDIVEFCYVKSQNLDKLMFFYVITGRRDKLRKLSVALRRAGDLSRRFLVAILDGDDNEKASALTDAGRKTLANLAKFNLKKQNEKDGEKLEEGDNENEEEERRMAMEGRGMIVTLKPVVNPKNKEYNSNWNCVTEVKKTTQISSIENILNEKEEEGIEDGVFNQIANENEEKEEVKTEEKKITPSKISDKWKEDDEEEGDAELARMLAEAQGASEGDSNKESKSEIYVKEKDFISDSKNIGSIIGKATAVGDFKCAFGLMRSQLGVREGYEKFKDIMKEVYMSGYSQLRIVPNLGPIEMELRTGNGNLGGQSGVNVPKLNLLLQKGYECISNFEMSEALKIFRDIIKLCVFFVANSEEEEKKIKEIISICTEYIYLTRISLMADEIKEKDKVKYCELVCLMSICKLEQNEHKFLIYKKAKYCCKNIKNFITALYFIKKMSSFSSSLSSSFPKEFSKISEERPIFEKIGSNKHNLNFNISETYKNFRDFFTATELKNIKNINENSNDNTEKLICPLCKSIEEKKFKGKICKNCEICSLGEEALGYRVRD